MGLRVEIKNIESTNDFELYYKIGNTPGSFSDQSNDSWGDQYTGGTSVNGVFSSTTSGITIDLMEENIVKEPYEQTVYGKQFWFKIKDKITGRYIIENIFLHQKLFYNSKCFNC